MRRFTVFLLIVSIIPNMGSVRADDGSSLDINNDVIYQDEEKDRQSDYDTIRSQLFLEKQNNRNKEVLEKEKGDVYNPQENLFLEKKTEIPKMEDTFKETALFGQQFKLEDDYSSSFVENSGQTSQFLRLLFLIMGAVCMAVVGWVLGKNKRFRNFRNKGLKV